MRGLNALVSREWKPSRKSLSAWTRDVEVSMWKRLALSICRTNSSVDYTLAPSRDEARVYCAEPLSSNFKVLFESSGSSLWRSSVVFIQAAASNAVAPNGSVTMVVHSRREKAFGTETAQFDLQERGPGLIKLPNAKRNLYGV